jgi:hypothetical protein
MSRTPYAVCRLGLSRTCSCLTLRTTYAYFCHINAVLAFRLKSKTCHVLCRLGCSEILDLCTGVGFQGEARISLARLLDMLRLQSCTIILDDDLQVSCILHCLTELISNSKKVGLTRDVENHQRNCEFLYARLL